MLWSVKDRMEMISHTLFLLHMYRTLQKQSGNKLAIKLNQLLVPMLLVAVI